MSDRLPELLRQRALVQEHLAWLDREIAAASGAPLTPPPSALSDPSKLTLRQTPAPASAPLPAAPSYVAAQAAAITQHAAASRAAAAASTAASAESPLVTATAESILDEYRVPPDTLKTDVRKGCFLYFFVALGAVAALVTVLYFVLHHE